jgi:hypothetical protein
MTLRLTEEQDRALELLAESQHISKQEAVIRAIEAQAERLSTAADVRDWADFALDRYAGLLDRLSK